MRLNIEQIGPFVRVELLHGRTCISRFTTQEGQLGQVQIGKGRVVVDINPPEPQEDEVKVGGTE